MTPHPQRADALPSAGEPAEPLELTPDQIAVEPGFDQGQWAEYRAEERGAGGRQVLGWSLAVLAALWLGLHRLVGRPNACRTTAHLARSRAMGRGRGRPARASWPRLAHVRAHPAQGSRALHPVGDRNARREPIARGVARGAVATNQRQPNRADDDFEASDAARRRCDRQARRDHARVRQQQREAASPRRSARSRRRSRAQRHRACCSRICRGPSRRPGSWPSSYARWAANRPARRAQFQQQVGELADRAREADQSIADATDRLAARLAEIESAGALLRRSVNEAQDGLSGSLDALLERTSATLTEIRTGIDVQSSAVAALVEQATASIGKVGADSAEALASNLGLANSSLDSMANRVAEQERASQRMIAEIDRGLAMIDQRFTELASNGDERANHFLTSLTRARTELDTLAAQANSQDDAIGSLADRTATLRENIDRLTAEIREGVGIAIGEAQGSADRLAEAASTLKPEMGWIRDAAVEAGERLSTGGSADRRAAGPVRGAARERRRRRRRRSIEAGRACLDAGAGRARGEQPQRRDRPIAGCRAGPGQGSRLPRRRARARSDREGHPGDRRQAVRRRPARRWRRSSARTSRNGCARSRPSPHARWIRPGPPRIA